MVKMYLISFEFLMKNSDEIISYWIGLLISHELWLAFFFWLRVIF